MPEHFVMSFVASPSLFCVSLRRSISFTIGNHLQGRSQLTFCNVTWAVIFCVGSRPCLVCLARERHTSGLGKCGSPFFGLVPLLFCLWRYRRVTNPFWPTSKLVAALIQIWLPTYFGLIACHTVKDRASVHWRPNLRKKKTRTSVALNQSY